MTAQTRWPAEWEPQSAVWFTWPHNPETWPGKLGQMQAKFAEIMALASRYQKVRVNASAPWHHELLRRLADARADLEHVELFDHPSNDVWCRDHGATFVERAGRLAAVDWRFNAWGGKFPPWDLDEQLAVRMAQAEACDVIRSELFLEGGAIEGNGAGLLLTTEAVALNPNRNPAWSRSEVEAELRRCLGVETVFWLPGGIEGDDTDGHIDDLSRFVASDRLVTALCRDPRSPDYQILQRNREMLQDLRTVDGNRVEIIDLPMPDPLVAEDWRLEQLPASYANFLILNEALLVPVFDQAKNDAEASGLLQELFPDRELVAVDARSLVWEGGAVHCISQQVPALG